MYNNYTNSSSVYKPEPIEAKSKLDIALLAVARGFSIIPLQDNAKAPRRGFMGWEAQATTDVDQICTWWNRWPNANIGIATGPSNLIVIDLDMPDGVKNLKRISLNRQIPKTYTVHTASGGWHLYFKAPQGSDLGNTASKLAPNIDTRGSGGYVVGAGSQLSTTGSNIVCHYTEHCQAKIAALPYWLCDLLVKKPAVINLKPEAIKISAPKAYVAKAIADEVAKITITNIGYRNHQLNTSAYRLGRFVASGEATEEQIAAELITAGVAVGMSEKACRATITSAINAAKTKVVV